MMGGPMGYGGGYGMGGGGMAGGSKQSVVLQVPDQMVGAIVGRAGQTINEIMQNSGTRVQISQKGDYIPGTRNRSVTVSGAGQAVEMATGMITSRLQEEASKTGQALPDLTTGMPAGGMGGGGMGNG